MTPHHAILLARLCLALTAIPLAIRRPALRPLAFALAALLILDAAYGWALATGARRIGLAIWLLWPSISAALSWRAWRGRWWPVALAFAAYALAAALAPWPWREYPVAYAVAVRAPFWLSPAASLVAWATGDRSRGAGAVQQASLVLAASGLLDVTVGALAADAVPWSVARALTWATMAALMAVGGSASRG